MRKNTPKQCAKCRYFNKDYCTVKALMIADPHRERMCKMHKPRRF